MEKRATLHVLPGPRTPHRPAPDGARATAAEPGPTTDGVVRVGVMGGDPLARAGIRALLEGRPEVHVVSDVGAPQHGVCPPREPGPDVIVVHGRPGFAPKDVPVPHPGDTIPLITIGGPSPEPATAWAHSHLPATATPGQLAAAVVLAAAGYTLTRGQKPLPHRASARSQVSQVSPEHLTRRESEVLDLLAGGMSNGEIARSLSLSEHTVKTHVQNLMNKLRLRNRVHAAIYAYETGMRHPC
ncbi:response regulator transcription factor [Streptomyces canus]|uniref:response regulator transcription factor n=1 Tax=Streptomyces canus TaxID=58343 RepID=UPI002E270D9F